MNPLDPSGTPDPAPSPDGQPTPAPAPALTDDTPVTVQVNGKDTPVPLADLRKGYMLQSDYTRKTQEVARQRGEFEAAQAAYKAEREAFDSQVNQFRSIVSDRGKLQGLLLAMHAQQQEPVQPRAFTDQDLPSIEDRILKAVEARLVQERSSFTTAQQQQRLEQDLDAFTGAQLSEHPTLKAVPGIDEAVYARVAAMRPSSADEAKSYTKLVISEMAQANRTAWEEHAKTAALDKARAGNGIEPRGGLPVLPTPKVYTDPRERAEAIDAFLQGIGKDL